MSIALRVMANWQATYKSKLCERAIMTALINRNNLIGIAALCAGTFVFSLQDAIIKAISGENAVSLAIVLRAAVSFPCFVGHGAF
jgi:hypothetical protein